METARIILSLPLFAAALIVVLAILLAMAVAYASPEIGRAVRFWLLTWREMGRPHASDASPRD